MNLTVNDLSPDQRAAYDTIVDWIDDIHAFEAGTLTLGGYAGSGKSTLVSLVAAQVNLPAFCAYTGKASSVLKRKLAAAGVTTVGTQRRREDGGQSLERRPYCGTIHSLIYQPCSCLEPQIVVIQKPCRECDAETRFEDGFAVCKSDHRRKMTPATYEGIKSKEKLVRAQKDENGKCKVCHGKEWLRRERLDRDYNLIIVDEASMVDDTMLRDLQSYEVPILAVGDHGQLPPVGASGSLMKNPQLRLEKIHRQAEGNPIITLSKYIREEGRLPDRVEELLGEAVTFGQIRFVEQVLEERYGDASPARLLEMGLACYTNRRRVGLNVAVRRARGTARVGRELPRAGEHVVCLRNMKGQMGAPPIYNGMRGVLAGNADPKLIRDPHGELKNAAGEPARESPAHLVGAIAFPEDGIDPRPYEMLRHQFCREKTFSDPEELQKETGVSSFKAAGALFDFGYAMTVHKMQGSQYDDLVVVAERPGMCSAEDYKKWLYTAVTRAAKRLTVLR